MIPSDPAWQAELRRVHVEQASSGELWGKRYYDPLGIAPDRSQVVEREGLFSIGERYSELRVALHAHLRVRSRLSDVDPHDVCVGAFRVPGGSGYEVKNLAVPLRDGDWDAFWQWEHARCGGKRCVKGAVLVTVGEPEEMSEGIGFGRLLVSYKWLELLDDFFIPCAESLSAPAAMTGLPRVWGKRDMEAVILGDCAAAMGDEGADEIVERGTKVMDDLANKDRPGLWGLPLDVEDILTCVSFEASEDAVACLFKEGAPFLVERCKVFVCPIESEASVL